MKEKNTYKMYKKINLRKKLKGFFSWTEEIGPEAKLFFATSFNGHVLLHSFTCLHVASL